MAETTPSDLKASVSDLKSRLTEAVALRLELAMLELDELKENVSRTIFGFIVAALFTLIAFVMFQAWLIIWLNNPATTALLLTILNALIAAAGGLFGFQSMKRISFLKNTLAEIRKDIDILTRKEKEDGDAE